MKRQKRAWVLALSITTGLVAGCGGGGNESEVTQSPPIVSEPAGASSLQPTPPIANAGTPASSADPSTGAATPPAGKPLPDPVTAPSLPPPPPANLATWGDSLTNDYSRTLQTLLPNTVVFHGGVGGQISTQIAARQGGVVPLLRADGDIIPSSSPVAIVAQSVAMQTSQGPGPITGTFGGVHGTLVRSSDGFIQFTRDVAGDAIPISTAEPFTVDTLGRRAWPTIFWYGRNNSGSLTTVLSDLGASVAFLENGHRKFLVLSVLNGAGEGAGTGVYESIAKLNAALASAYPDNYFDMRAYLVSQYDPELPQDVMDHDNDIVPTSLRRDALHMKTKGSNVIAAKLKELIAERGW